jgi:hypothetical protein
VLGGGGWGVEAGWGREGGTYSSSLLREEEGGWRGKTEREGKKCRDGRQGWDDEEDLFIYFGRAGGFVNADLHEIRVLHNLGSVKSREVCNII